VVVIRCHDDRRVIGARSHASRIQSVTSTKGCISQQVHGAPQWALPAGPLRASSQGLILERLTASVSKGSQFLATHEHRQNTFDFVVSFFVMLYIMFFPAA
jgi:hypothetical protein